MQKVSSPPTRPKKVLITGTGRAGTTFLICLLTELGLDTGFSKDTYARRLDRKARAGLEHVHTAKPAILKNPNFCLSIPDIAKAIDIEHVYVPVRNLADAAASRVVCGSQKQPGGLWLTSTAADQPEKLGYALGKLISDLIHLKVPFTLLRFETMVTDRKYLFDALQPLLKETTFDRFTIAYNNATKVTAPHTKTPSSTTSPHFISP